MLVFWGLVLEPSKRYTQKVQQSFHVSQAALELTEGEMDPVQLILEYDGATYILGTLSKKGFIYQVPLDLNFNTGDQISFRTIGKGRVHLTGYHLTDEDMTDMRLAEASALTDENLQSALAQTLLARAKRKKTKVDKSQLAKIKKRKLNPKKAIYEEDSEEEASEEEEEEEEEEDAADDDEEDSEDFEFGDSDEEEGEEEEEEDEEEEEEEEEEENDSDENETPTKAKKKTPVKNLSPKLNGKSPKKQLSETKQSSKLMKQASPVAKVAKDKTPKSEKKSPKGEKKDQSKQDFTPVKKVVEGGVIVEEIKVGEGQAAKPGKMVQVYYVGRLQSNNKQFDSTTQGPGFKFKLGKGEVIRGWDIGVNGMKVGGKRKITIPAQLGYGAKGAPPAIPPNSVLVFDIELRGVN